MRKGKNDCHRESEKEMIANKKNEDISETMEKEGENQGEAEIDSLRREEIDPRSDRTFWKHIAMDGSLEHPNKVGREPHQCEKSVGKGSEYILILMPPLPGLMRGESKCTR